MWLYGKPERQACFSTKVLVRIDQGKVSLQMGSIKDTDRSFDKTLYKVWFCNTGKIEHGFEALIPTADQAFKVDLRETEIPAGLPKEYRQE